MLSKKNIQSMARFMAICFICVACLGTSVIADAATKLTGTFGNVSQLGDEVPSYLYLDSVYKVNDGYIGTVGYSYLATTDDLITWNVIVNASAYALTVGNGIALTYDIEGLVCTEDGKTWNSIDLGDKVQGISNVFFADGYFVVLYYDNEYSYQIMISKDCASWLDLSGDLPKCESLEGITVLNNRFFIVVINENWERELYSADSITESAAVWTEVALPEGATYLSFSPNGFVANVTYDEEYNGIYTFSTDGVNWKDEKWDYEQYYDFTYKKSTEPVYSYGNGVALEWDYDTITSYITIDEKEHEVKLLWNGKAIETKPEPAPSVAKPTASKVLVNGKNVSFDAYEISGNNYFKLRDLAYILNGSEKQFGVDWDGSAIILTSGAAYNPVGGEMTGKGTGDKAPKATSSKIILDGADVQFTAYEIDGNNYFKLRDLGETFDFEVDWDGANNTIVVDTSMSYTAD